MKFKDFQVRDVTLRAQKWLNPEHGHDRCYLIYYMGCDEEVEYVLPLYPPAPKPVFTSEIVMVGKQNFEVTYCADYTTTWVCNKKKFEDALNATLDMYIADSLHKTMIEYNIYYTVDRDEFYYVYDVDLWWLYHIKDGGTKSTSRLICCVKDKNVLEYVMRVFEKGPEFILEMVNNAKKNARERER